MARAFAAVSSLKLPLLGAVLFGALLSGCGRPVGPAACTDPRDCAAGESCNAGICGTVVGGACTTDLDCDPSSGQICQQGTCIAGDPNVTPNNDGGACTATADCPITQFCNTGTGFCAALLDGWCRQDSQCKDDAALCSNVTQGGSDYPGRCVECITNDDCGGNTCISPGVCEEDAGCGANASPQVGGTCRCNPGFVDNGAGCVPDLANEGEGEGGGVEGEGEGEGEEGEGDGGTVDGEACETASECFVLHDINWTCGDAGTCICDEPWLDFDCNGDYDLEACACGGGGGTSNPPVSASCDSSFDCGFDEDCFFGYGAGPSDSGSCKVICSDDFDCSGGLTCMVDGWVGSTGFCADVRQVGESCDASVFSADISSNSICDGSDDTVIFDCFAGTCEQVCDYDGNTGGEMDCNAGTCGTKQPRAETTGNVAVCE